MPTFIIRFVVAALIVGLLAACAGVPPMPTPAPVATATPAPTRTKTPLPTATPNYQATATAIQSEAVRIRADIDFIETQFMRDDFAQEKQYFRLSVQMKALIYQFGQYAKDQVCVSSVAEEAYRLMISRPQMFRNIVAAVKGGQMTIAQADAKIAESTNAINAALQRGKSCR